MDVGVAGIGDIATKAYLPLLATWPDVRLHLASRDEVRLEQAAWRFGAASVAPELEQLLERDLDAVLVTAATDAHPRLVTVALEAGVPVHVDKPLASSAEEASELVGTAERHGTLLAVGFNRRFAPAYRRVAEGAPRLVVMGKHRPDLADLPRRVIFDDLIHVVDTLRWLIGAGDVDPQVTGHVADGRLHHIAFTLAHEGRHAIGLMNRSSGTTREVLEAHQPEATTLVHDLAHTEIHGTSDTRVRGPGSWTPTLEVRGFVAMLEAFFAAVSGEPTSTPSAEDALATHVTCEHILAQL